MFTIIDEDFEYIPVQYNMAWADGIKKEISVSVTSEEIDMLVKYSNKPGNYIWDFRNIKYANDRIFFEAFFLLTQRRRQVFFAYIQKGSSLENAMISGVMEGRVHKLESEEERYNHYFIGEYKGKEFNEKKIEKIKKTYIKEIIQKTCIETQYQYLVSSGVYSNMQINLKNLFTNVEGFSFVIYLLWEQVGEIQADGIIATSKNGVAFVSVLGEILGLQTLYFNIGQMFEETYNCSPAINKGGKYIHIYDMICLGSETKVLNALVDAQGGEIVKSIGCVCLLDLDIVRHKNRYSSMNRVWSLLGHKDLNCEYKIFFDSI